VLLKAAFKGYSDKKIVSLNLIAVDSFYLPKNAITPVIKNPPTITGKHTD
jgi:hypothetical protein